MKERLFISIRLGAASVFAAFLLFVASCQDKDYHDPDYLPSSGLNASDLNFSTTRNVRFDFNGLLDKGLIMAFDVYAENPYVKNSAGVWEKRSDLSPIAGGIDVEGVTNINRILPAYVTELYVLPSTLFAPALMKAVVSNDVATFNVFDISNDVTQDAATRTLGTASVDKYLSPTLLKSGAYYRPAVDLKSVAFPTAVKNAISTTFADGTKADSKFYKDASIEIMREDNKDEGAELWVSVVHSDGLYNNSLMYFCYNGDKQLSELTADDRASLKVISAFQFAKIGAVSGALTAGEYIQLKYYNGQDYVDRFPIGTKIGWVLASNGFNQETYSATTKPNSVQNPWFYSIPSWNPEQNNQDHTISFAVKHEGVDYICFGFEDTYNEKVNGIEPGDADCNDVMFHVISNPIKALDPPPYIQEEGTIEAVETKTGTLLFEDNWPRKGDYDLNDVVVKYRSDITYVQNTLDGQSVGDVMVKSIQDTMSIVNDGALFHNAFSYKVGWVASNLESLTIDNEAYTADTDGNGFIIDLCADVKEIRIPRSYSVAMRFKDGVLKSDDLNNADLYPYGKAPYNPFIKPTNLTIVSDSIEVHLPFYPPTKRADMDLFGSYDDASNKETGSFYAAAAGTYYPYAIHLAGVTSLYIPDEGKPIHETYPQYTSWVNNGCGLIDADWYLYPNP